MADELVPEEQPQAAAADGADSGAAAGAAQATLQRELEAARKQADEYLDGWRRAQADMANQRRRHERERGEIQGQANARLITQLLPVLDDFERATQTVPPDLEGAQWVDGVLLIARKIQQLFEAEGLRAIPVKPGDEFDPSVHDAVLRQESPDIESGHIVAELQKGYTLGDRVIRPAKVSVAS